MELNFGNPAELSGNKLLYDLFINKLKRKVYRYDSTDYALLKKYTDSINIKIGRDSFYRYGWELSKTDTVAFNTTIEYLAKRFMYGAVVTSKAAGHSLSKSIDLFQEKYDFPESVWPKESIYRDCTRNLNKYVNEDSVNSSEFVIESLKNLILNNFVVKNN
jgi:hypothetical protein